MVSTRGGGDSCLRVVRRGEVLHLLPSPVCVCVCARARACVRACTRVSLEGGRGETSLEGGVSSTGGRERRGDAHMTDMIWCEIGEKLKNFLMTPCRQKHRLRMTVSLSSSPREARLVRASVACRDACTRQL